MKQNLGINILKQNSENNAKQPKMIFQPHLYFCTCWCSYLVINVSGDMIMTSNNKLLLWRHTGITREMRGDIWCLFQRQWELHNSQNSSHSSQSGHNSSYDGHNSSNNNSSSIKSTVNYDELLKKLTTHQHAILIDLGEYFSKLFNLNSHHFLSQYVNIK